MDKHNKDRFTAYITGTLTPAERDEMDQLLAQDEEALASYLMSLEMLVYNDGMESKNNSEMFSFPNLPNQEEFTDHIMKQIASSRRSEERKKKSYRIKWRDILSHKMVHYTVAASITVLFISTGVFDQIASVNLNKGQTGGTQPYSEIMTQKAAGWLDSLKPKP
ncbi:hypothetical protein [Paenibacillus sp. Marseille-Q4541]|uniref:hypothetical protein n=1 Tax=Paenibacillus sp. Marseille-Q4541 TaxID=2831522 RepID=UPI001BA94C19|nr:hypothetical protein [Paenibacillus sp. Marseille-Q4541]